jgi:alpha-D-ribose 1-methylphosphonate 5-triphosphate synthase subunit PhnG
MRLDETPEAANYMIAQPSGPKAAWLRESEAGSALIRVNLGGTGFNGSITFARAASSDLATHLLFDLL